MNYLSSTYINTSISRLATQYVGQYLEGIEPDKFAVAWKSGNLRLSDVRIRKEVVDVINLPVSLLHGWVGTVSVSLPLGNIFSLRATATPQPLVIELDDVYVVLGPKPEEQSDSDLLIERYRLSRQRLLDECDVRLLAVQAQEQLAQRAKNVAASSAKGQEAGWAARLASRVLADIQFCIRSIHLRYEDSINSFALGMTLEQLQIRTPTREEWDTFTNARAQKQDDDHHHHHNADGSAKGNMTVPLREKAGQQQKLLCITNVTMYHNSGARATIVNQSGQSTSQDHINRMMREMVAQLASPQETSKDYILRPFSCSVGVEIGTTSPRARASSEEPTLQAKQGALYRLYVGLELLKLTVSKTLFRNLKTITASIAVYKEQLAAIEDRYELYHPYRPVIPICGNAKIWWKYSVGCIVRRLNKDLPEGSLKHESIWDWGGHLKEARIAAWRRDYKTILTEALNSTETGVIPPDSHWQKELSQLQELLPRKELLQVYITTKQAFLANLSQVTSAAQTKGGEVSTWSTVSTSSASSQSSTTSWWEWFRRGDTGSEAASHLQKEPSVTEDMTFYDVEEESISEFRREPTEPSNPPGRSDEFADAVEGPLSRLSNGGHEYTSPATSRASSTAHHDDIVDRLLETEEMTAELLVDLESVELCLQVSHSSSVSGKVSGLRIAGRLDERLTTRIALQDLSMMYQESAVAPPQRFLARWAALDKSFFFMYFCTRDSASNVPRLHVDVQHISLLYIPAVIGECMDVLKILQSTETPVSSAEENDILATSGTNSSLLAVEKLSSAKHLAANAYRNAEIDITIAAPTIILPASPLAVGGAKKASSQRPVLVAHLGSLTIRSVQASLPPPIAHPLIAGCLVTYVSNQQFEVSFKEIYIDYFEAYQLGMPSYIRGLSVVDQFGFSITLSFRTTQQKNVLRAFMGPLRQKGGTPTIAGSSVPQETNSDSAIGSNAAPSGHPSLDTSQTSVEIRGTLPALTITLDYLLFESVVFAVTSLTVIPPPRQHTDDVTASLMSSCHPTSAEQFIFGDLLLPVRSSGPSGQRYRQLASRSLVLSLNEDSASADSSNNDSDTTAQLSWPPDFAAIFSLALFRLSVNCARKARATQQIEMQTRHTTAELRVKKDLPEESSYRYIIETEVSPLFLPSKNSVIRFPFDVDPAPNQDGEEGVTAGHDDSLVRNSQDATFISVKTAFASAEWSKEVHCQGASALIDITFTRFLRITFQPEPLKDFITFWRSWPSQKWRDTSTPHQRTRQKLAPTRSYLRPVSRDKDKQTLLLKLSVLGVSCACVEASSNALFAICEFDSMGLDFSLREFGTDISCRLSNLRITDCSSKDERHRQLFGVIPGEGYLLSIQSSTTDPTAPYFDGTGLNLLVEFGQVEIVCLVAKLLRIFRWIFDGLLATLTAAPSEQSLLLSRADLSPRLEPTSSSFIGSPQKSFGRGSALLQNAPSALTDSTTAKPFRNSGTLEQQRNASFGSPHHVRHGNLSSRFTTQPFDTASPYFRNPGEKVLTAWLLRAADCMAQLGGRELSYLKKRCKYNLPIYQQDAGDTDTSEYEAETAPPPLTLRRYKIHIRRPTLIIPVTTYDTEYARLTVESITIANSATVHPQYGLLDDVNVLLHNVTICAGESENVILSEVDINVHYLLALLTVSPRHPMWMTFEFSDVPWLLDSQRLNLLLRILWNNVLGEDQDVIVEHHKVNTAEESEHDVPTATAPTELQSCSNTIEDNEPVSLTSLFEFVLPGLFVFLSPDEHHATLGGATICFHADLLQCRISKNTKGVLSIQVTANSARILHCRRPGSPLRIVLSDSQKNLMEVAAYELSELRRLEQLPQHCLKLPEDVLRFIHADDEQASKGSDSGDLLQNSNLHEGHSSPHTGTEELFCHYESKTEGKDLRIDVHDPRLVIERSFIEDITHYVNNLDITSRKTATKPDLQQPPLQESSFGITVQLVNASVIAPELADASMSSLLVLRGSFQATRNKVIAIPTDTEGPLIKIVSPHSADLQLTEHVAHDESHGSQLKKLSTAPLPVKDSRLASKETRTEPSDEDKDAIRYSLTVHHTLSMASMDVFRCDLVALASLEVFEAARRTAENQPHSVSQRESLQGETTRSIPTLEELFDEDPDDLLVGSLIARYNRLRQSENGKHPAASESHVCSRATPSRAMSFSRSPQRAFLQAPSQRTLRDMLHLPASVIVGSLSHARSGYTETVDAGCNWEDLIRLLCPNAECLIDISDRWTVMYTCKTGLLRTETPLTRHAVISIHPISVQLSYNDLLFIRRMLQSIGSTSSTSAPSSQTSAVTASSQATAGNDATSSTPGTNDVLTRTHLDCDFTELKVLLLNDSMEYLSAPFVEVSVKEGSLSGDIRPSISSSLDVSLSFMMQFFNPRAVAFEPVLEEFRTNFRYVMTAMSNRTFTDCVITGSPKTPLCVNISDVLLASCLQNYRKWCRDVEAAPFESVSSVPSEAGGVLGSPGPASGMFRFTPYSLRNSAGMDLRVSIPSTRKRHRSVRLERALSRTPDGPQHRLVHPGETQRLTELQVNVHLQQQSSFKVGIEISKPEARLYYALDGLVPVERLGLYLFRAIPVSSNNDSTDSVHREGVPKKQSETRPGLLASAATQYIVCRVDVSEGQKRLTVESQVMIQNDLGHNLALEVFVSLPPGSCDSSAERMRLVVPPNSVEGVPAYACSSASLAFRPRIWKPGAVAPHSYDNTFSTSTTGLSQTSASQDGSETFSWSKSLHLPLIWRRICVLEREPTDALQRGDDAGVNATTAEGQLWFPSGLPKFLPIETLVCRHQPPAEAQGDDGTMQRSPTRHFGNHRYFFMATDLRWETCVYRDRRCQQVRLSVRPPFVIQSTVPTPLTFHLETSVPAQFSESLMSPHSTPRRSDTAVNEPNASVASPSLQLLSRQGTSAPRKHTISSSIELNGVIRVFSLPLHETATLVIDPFGLGTFSPPVQIFRRTFPKHSTQDVRDDQMWRRFWIQEGGHRQVLTKKHAIRVYDREGRSFRIESILQSRPGHPVHVLLHCPIWLVSYIAPTRPLASSPLAYAYKAGQTDAPVVEPSKPLRRAESSEQPESFKGRTLVPVSYDQQGESRGSRRLDDHRSSRDALSAPRSDPTHRRHDNDTRHRGRDRSSTVEEDNDDDVETFNSAPQPDSARIATLRHRYTGSTPLQTLLKTMTHDASVASSSSVDPIFGESAPICLPLDCAITELQLLYGESVSNSVSVTDIQQDQLVQLHVPCPLGTHDTTTRHNATSRSGSSSSTRSPSTVRLCEFVFRVSTCPLSLPQDVKLVSIAHRYFLLNDTPWPLLYRQHQTSSVFQLGIREKKPIEWTDAQKPQCISLRPHSDGWFWGGRICPLSIEGGGHFVYHLAPEAKSGQHHIILRVEKHLASTTVAPFASIILRLVPDSLDLPDAVQIVNHSRFKITISQNNSPPARAFHMERSESLHFAWDDNLLPADILLLPDTPYYEKGAVVELPQLLSGKSQTIRCNQSSSRFWFTLIASRRGSLRVLHLHDYQESPSRERRALHHSDTLRREELSQKLSHIPTPSLFDASRSVFVDTTLSFTLTLPTVYVSVITDLPRPRVVALDKYGDVSEELRKRHVRIRSSLLSAREAPAEFVSVYFEDCRARYIGSHGRDLLAITIKDLQVDNPQPTALFPVALQRLGVSSSTTLKAYESRQLLTDVDLEVDIERHPLVDILISRRLQPDDAAAAGLLDTATESGGGGQVTTPTVSSFSVMHFSLVRIIVLGLIAKADMDFVDAALAVTRSYSAALSTNVFGPSGEREGLRYASDARGDRPSYDAPSNSSLSKLASAPGSLVERQTGAQFSPARIELATAFSAQKCYFETFTIHPLLLRLSFSPVSSMFQSTNGQTSLIRRLFSTVGSIQEVPIYFRTLRLRDQAKATPALVAMMKSFYMTQLMRQSYALATSVDLLGNPLSTLSHIGAGLSDLVAEPVRCLNENAEAANVMEGIGKGAKSFWDNAVYGAFNVVSKVSGVAAQGLGVLALDEEYTREQQQQGTRRRPRDASEGIAMGAEAFGRAVVGGLKGLVTEPSRGVEEKGFEGLLQGVGKGVVGALVKPVAGVFEMTALATGGMQEAAGESSGVARGRRKRRRPPRCFYGADRIIRPYSIDDARLSDVMTYMPGLDWSFYVVDTILHDPDRNCAVILNDDELLTLTLRPAPQVDFYCDLWNIASCEVVAERGGTSRSSSSHQETAGGGRHRVKTIGMTGVFLRFHQPSGSRRSILTSTVALAVELAAIINEKVSKL